MWRFLADECFNAAVLRGLKVRHPDVDIVTVHDVGLTSADDRVILAWATQDKRIVLSHDEATLPVFAYERISNSESMLGVFILREQLAVKTAIRELSQVVSCADPEEFTDLEHLHSGADKSRPKSSSTKYGP